MCHHCDRSFHALCMVSALKLLAILTPALGPSQNMVPCMQDPPALTADDMLGSHWDCPCCGELNQVLLSLLLILT